MSLEFEDAFQILHVLSKTLATPWAHLSSRAWEESAVVYFTSPIGSGWRRAVECNVDASGRGHRGSFSNGFNDISS